MMVIEEMKASVNGIKLSDEARRRIIVACRAAEARTSRHGAGAWFRRHTAAAVAAALCLCLAVTAAAAAGLGYFRDVARWDGAVTGTAYEQATEELTVRAVPDADGVTVTAAMVFPDRFPWRGLEELGIGTWRVEDGAGNVAAAGGPTDMVRLVGATAEIALPLAELPAGEYRLFIDAFTGGAKAEQPLSIQGAWECGFTR